MNDEQIARINELYHKSKGEGLTKEEAQEQKELRAAYIAAIRKNMRGQMDNISILNKDGSVTDLKDVRKKKH